MTKWVGGWVGVALQPCFADPRTAAMGIRVYHRRSSSFAPPPGLAEASAKEYRLHRILHAVPEGIDELEPVRFQMLARALPKADSIPSRRACFALSTVLRLM